MSAPGISMQINVLINGQPFALASSATLLDAVVQLGITPPFAAAINLQFVPQTQYPHTQLQEGDQIDLIAPVTGG